jgi:D-galactarolactone cycloisomerase
MPEFDRTQHPIRQAILTRPIEHIGGIVRVPDGPGLGIEVNREALFSLAAPGELNNAYPLRCRYGCAAA